VAGICEYGNELSGSMQPKNLTPINTQALWS